jgi:hypothetical protein
MSQRVNWVLDADIRSFCKCRCKTPQKRRLKIPQVG